MNISDDKAPPLGLLLREGLSLLKRSYSGFGRLGERGPDDGPRVMVIPGFLGSDRATLGLQRALARAGYRATGWQLGVNLGVKADTLGQLVDIVERFGRGRPVTLIGWSLGGLFARETAKLRPDLIHKVVTMGAPFAGDLRANNAWRLYEWIAGHRVDDPPVPVDLTVKPPVPTVALWSRRDGMVAPACARGEEGQSDRRIEISCTHMGFAVDPKAFPHIIAALSD